MKPTLNRNQALQIIVGAIVIFGMGFATGQRNLITNRPPATVSNADKNQSTTADFGLFWEAWNKVGTDYIKTPDDKERVYGAIGGMVASLGDPYSVFLKPTAAKQFSQDLNGNFDGIGAELIHRDGVLTVVAPLEGSPAKRAGLQPGDIVIKIDGNDVPDSIDEAVSKIRGPKGTNVTLQVVRNNEPRDITITREKVDILSVTYIKKDKLGIIKLNQFNANSTELMDKALSQAKSDNVTGLIIDARNDPGGLLNVAVSITSRFIEPGVVVVERDKAGRETSLSTDKAVNRVELPMVVLVNKGSASAAEIFAGALQDNGRAKIVGETTFGKGSVQSVEPLSDGSSLRVTVAEWLTPKKRAINKVGITPDVEVKLTEEDAKAARDPQLDKAVELLR